MILKNDPQKDACQKWVERCNKHIIDLQVTSKRSSVPLDDALEVARELRDYLDARILDYESQEKPDVQEEETTTAQVYLGRADGYGHTDPEPEGSYEGSEGTESEEITEIADDLLSNDLQKEPEAEDYSSEESR